MDSSSVKIAQGLAAGFWATVPMSLLMLGIKRWIQPQTDKLSPRQITENLTEKMNAGSKLSEAQIEGLTIPAHFAYGAATGAIYHLATLSHTQRREPLTGALYGVAIYGLSYWLLLPLLGILPPPQRYPLRKHVNLFASHIVWGAALGDASRRFSKR